VQENLQNFAITNLFRQKPFRCIIKTNAALGWMHTYLKLVFFEEFVPKVAKFKKKKFFCGQPQKAILLIDNTLSHSHEIK
jgi:hypothetical protein